MPLRKNMHWRTALCYAVKSAWAIGRQIFHLMRGASVRTGDTWQFTYKVEIVPLGGKHRWWDCVI